MKDAYLQLFNRSIRTFDENCDNRKNESCYSKGPLPELGAALENPVGLPKPTFRTNIHSF